MSQGNNNSHDNDHDNNNGNASGSANTPCPIGSNSGGAYSQPSSASTTIGSGSEQANGKSADDDNYHDIEHGISSVRIPLVKTSGFFTVDRLQVMERSPSLSRPADFDTLQEMAAGKKKSPFNLIIGAYPNGEEKRYHVLSPDHNYPRGQVLDELAQAADDRDLYDPNRKWHQKSRNTLG